MNPSQTEHPCTCVRLILASVALILAFQAQAAGPTFINHIHHWRASENFVDRWIGWDIQMDQADDSFGVARPGGTGADGVVYPDTFVGGEYRVVSGSALNFFWHNPTDYGSPIQPCNPATGSATGFTECWFPDGDCGTMKVDPDPITADGQSTSQATLSTPSCFPNGPVWEIVGDSLGCTIDETGLITAGYAPGPITVRAKHPTIMSRFVDGHLVIKECGTCTSDCGVTANNSVDVRITFGEAAYGRSAGYLQIKETQPGWDLATPAKLRFIRGSAKPEGNSYDSIVEEVPGTGTQYKAPNLLAWVRAVDAYSYTISFYKTKDISNPWRDYNYGQYQLKTGPPAPEPYKTWTIANPDGPNANTRLNVTESRDGINIVSSYEYMGDGWKLTKDDGNRKERRVIVDFPATGTHVHTFTVRDGNDALKYQVVRTYKDFLWGASSGVITKLTNEVVGTGPTALTNAWIFYESPSDGNNYKHLRMTITPTGHWETYQYDSAGRKTRVVSQFKNNAIPTSTSEENLNRVTTITYDATPGQEQYLTKLNGVVVSHVFRIKTVGGQDEVLKEITCTNPAENTAWDDPGNLVRTTWTYRVGTPALVEGRIHQIKNVDGTYELYTYAAGGGVMTTTIDRGIPNGSATVITEGERTLRATDASGNLLSEKIFVISNSNVDTSKGLYARVAITTPAFDDFGRPTAFTNLDASTESVTYSCCGQQTFGDRSGLLTTTEYDSFRRVKSVLKAGLTTKYDYDAAGRLTKTTRIGSDGDSGAIVLENRTYDDAGRLTSTDDPLRQVTQYLDRLEGGYYVKTNKYPNGSTRIESYFQDGSLYRVYGTAVNELKYDYGADDDGEYTKEIKVRGASESEWVKTYKDTAGRIYMTTYPTTAPNPTPKTISFFNSLGQLTKTIDPDGVAQLFSYDTRGRLYRSALDLNANGQIDTGSDRVTEFTYTVATRTGGPDVKRKTTTVYDDISSVSTALAAQVEDVSLDERDSWVKSYNQETHTHIDYDPAHTTTKKTETFPDNSSRFTEIKDGRVKAVTNFNNVGTAAANVIGWTTNDYDTHFRLWTITDGRNGPTTNVYYNDGRPYWTSTPAPGGGASAQGTTNQYNDLNASGRIEIVMLPDGTKTTNEFFLTGELKRQSGSRTYPVDYTYDWGRIKTMKTWTNAFTGNYATTTWNYSADRGFLSSKTDNSTKGPTYTYTDAGRLKTRQWARTGTVTTTYTYQLGDLYTIDYSDTGANPDITYTYNRRGKVSTVVDQTGTHVMPYDSAGLLDYEDNTSGTLSGIKVDHHYDSLARRDYIEVQKSTVAQFKHEYAYDEASRLKKVFQATTNVIYAYEPNSSLIQTVTLKSAGEGGSTMLTTTKAYDYINRLTSISSAGQSTVSFAYAYNVANQRTSSTLQDSSQWNYQYDKLGQVTSGKRSWSDGTPVAGQQYEYLFDDIGNRRRTRQGGDNYAVNLRTASYVPNALNQYTSRTVPGYVDIIGTAASDSTATVDDNPSLRKGAYFRAEVSLDNSSAGLSHDFTIRGVKFDTGGNQDVMTTANRTVFVPPAQESLSYDDDGNLTSDGRWNYVWDAENRLVQMTAKAYSLPNSARKKLVFTYDYMGRRVQKVVSTWNGSTYASAVTTRFVYDGWNLLAELDGDNSNAVKCSYMWGLDLSGSLQGAGGVGGLLTVSPGGTNGYFAVYDGNGNVTALSDSSGKISARYEYDPFGQTIRASGTAADSNPIRFSTKYSDSESSFAYYGLRFYNPSTGRWLSRDPITEKGGANLYSFNDNSPLTLFDGFGLCPCKCKKVKFESDSTTDRILEGASGGKLTLAVYWKVEVEGDRTKCHCRYIDKGRQNSNFYFKSGRVEKKYRNFDLDGITDPWPCKDFPDYPGPYFPKDWTDFIYVIRYNMTITFECVDEDGSGKLSDTATINALFIGTYPSKL